jgi:hypothetical protein
MGNNHSHNSGYSNDRGPAKHHQCRHFDRLGSDNVPLVAATALATILHKGTITVEDEEFRRVLLSNSTVSAMFFAGKNLTDVVIELVRQLDAAKPSTLSLPALPL